MAIKRPLLGEEERIGDGDAETKSDLLLPQLLQDMIPVTMSALAISMSELCIFGRGGRSIM